MKKNLTDKKNSLLPCSRRKFFHLTSAGVCGLMMPGFSEVNTPENTPFSIPELTNNFSGDLSLIGSYGELASHLLDKGLPSFSYRRKEWKKLETWRKSAQKRTLERMAVPDTGGLPEVTLKKQYIYDGLHIEELNWSLPYGPPVEAVLLKPAGVKEPLPGILAFHDHGGNKYFGIRKILRTSDRLHPLMETHQKTFYSGRGWANEIAKRGYVVLVSDTFAFGSRRVMLEDVPESLRQGLSDLDPENPDNIHAYNNWARQHEHIMAKSLFSAGTTWPAVFFAEDRKALDILCARKDVDNQRIGCGGLSGGGLRTVYMGGLDPRVKCAVCIGFMTTWKDFALNKSVYHTWMTYVPLLPVELDFPEILGLGIPLPSLVLNTIEDPLYTLPEMKNAEEILKEIYHKANADDHFKCSYYPGGHKFDKEMQDEAYEWFDRWLKK